MAVCYIVSYDLNKSGKDYKGLYEELKKSTSWWHYLDSTWLIYTSETDAQVYDRLKSHIDSDDCLLIIKVVSKYNGWLPKKAWEWIENHVTTS